MLEIKLEEARKKTSTTRMAIFGITVATALIVVLSIISINLYRDLETTRSENEALLSPPVQEKSNQKRLQLIQRVVPNNQSVEELIVDGPTKAHQSVVPLKTLKRDMRKEERQTPNVQPNTKPLIKKPTTSQFREALDLAREPVIQTSAAIQNTEEDRRLLRSELKKFDNRISPMIEGSGFNFWNQESQLDILFLRDQAVAAFGSGEFNQGLEHIRKASEIGKLELIDMENAFQSALEVAQRDKESDSYETAILNIERALALKPSSQPAQRLAEDIAKLPEVLKWLEYSKVANIENQKQKEYDLLKKILKLQPTRQGTKERADFLASEIREQKYTNHIKLGLSYVKKKQLKSAQKRLDFASNSFPNRDETKHLSKAVTVLKSDQKTNEFLKKARESSDIDDWAQSREYYSKARGVQPNNAEAQEGYALAALIISANDVIAQFIATPKRLSSKKIVKKAKEAIGLAAPIVIHSTALSQKTHVLSELIAAYSKKVLVKVLSDKQTKISVRGVGQVGVVTEKVIQLNPGSYTFEGKRDGYKSKLLRISVLPGDNQVEVKLICDERV